MNSMARRPDAGAAGGSPWSRALVPRVFLLLHCAAVAGAQDGGAAARELRRAGRTEEALVVLERALAADPADEDLLGLRGMLLLDAGRSEDAAALARDLAGYAGTNFRVHAFIGRQCLASGDTAGAIAASRRAVELKPEAAEPGVTLVQGLLAARRARAAVRASESLEAIAPDWGRRLGAQALLMQAQRMRQAGEESVPRAIPVLRAALEKQPGDKQILETLIETLIETLHVGEARSLVDEHFSGAADRALRHYLLGRSLAVMTDIEGADREFRAALDSAPAHEGALLELARIAIDDEDWAGARHWLDRIDSRSTGSGRSLLLCGKDADGLGNTAEARLVYEQEHAQAPENAKARYLLGRLLVRDGDLEQGMQLLAVQVTDDDP
jgi:tetratricopeptide (TPR) repeat protein